jgi:hypothetical protein
MGNKPKYPKGPQEKFVNDFPMNTGNLKADALKKATNTKGTELIRKNQMGKPGSMEV